MADGTVKLREDPDWDVALDNEEIAFGAAPLTRHRQRVRIGGSTATLLAEVTADGELFVVPSPPTARSGRTYVTATRVSTTANATLHTVTAGKTLYVSTITLSAFNSSIGTAGDLRIQDDAGTVLIPLVIAPAGAGALASSVGVAAINMTFIEPKRFTTDFRVVIVTGTITYAISFSGYEEAT